MRKVAISNGTTVVAIDPGVRLHGWCSVLCCEYPDDVRLFNQSEGYSETTNIEDVLWGINGRTEEYIVAVETPAGHAYSAARVKGLLDAAGAAGELRGLARAGGARVVSCSAETWRAALVGTAHASDQQIAERLSWEVKRGTLSCLPETRLKSERPHVLDACGLALVVATRGVDWVEAREAERRGSTKRQETLPGLGTKRRTKR